MSTKSRQCQSPTKSGGKCHNISLKGSNFCYLHLKNQPKSVKPTVKPIVEKRKNTNFGDLDDSIVQTMCQLYIDQGDYLNFQDLLKPVNVCGEFVNRY
jgi:hypothetical protein